ncbi:hypothetical protein PHLGIDRAFT_404323 [Phlebiopsis gigantea 11061_1 CR5-6]|uniref:Uncharacterized protein n=1 Tax=Phlebiopsis gigantea (strain 11061_1 CR5-6) TaxID=745531 RepID=A0A0C3SBG8_PHLG1|nr:hypothetical protein PHLGIDRAFT_404323 [Phlebiopsis gigantea 11061_1 CR5-6]
MTWQAVGGALLFAPEIYKTMKVYWFDNPTVLMTEMSKFLDEVERGIKDIEAHQKASLMGSRLAVPGRVDYCTTQELSDRLSLCRKFYSRYRLLLEEKYPSRWMFVADADYTVIERIKELSKSVKALRGDYIESSHIILFDEQDPEILSLYEQDE